MTHVDLFSGIGGFALAAAANGIETVQFVEIDERCREFLSKAWPGVAIHDDIRTFDGSKWAGAFLLTGGVPCQPASRAGKRRGKADHRWLWPEAIEVLGVVRPTWAIFENPPGIGDVELAGILSDVEAQGYAVRVFSIPACAVGSPQRRERYWLLAKSNHSRRENGIITEQTARYRCSVKPAISCRVADTEKQCRRSRTGRGDWKEFSNKNPWDNFVWLPCADGKLRRAPDCPVCMADGLHRSVLGALGNSIVWQVAAKIIEAIVSAERMKNV